MCHSSIKNEGRFAKIGQSAPGSASRAHGAFAEVYRHILCCGRSASMSYSLSLLSLSHHLSLADVALPLIHPGHLSLTPASIYSGPLAVLYKPCYYCPHFLYPLLS